MENIQFIDDWFGAREELEQVTREMELVADRLIENEIDDALMALVDYDSIVMIGEGGDLNAYAH